MIGLALLALLGYAARSAAQRPLPDMR